MGKRPRSVGARGRHTTSRHGPHAGRATRWCGPLRVRLRLFFGYVGRKYSKNKYWLTRFQFGGYFLKSFSETKNSRKLGTGTVASC